MTRKQINVRLSDEEFEKLDYFARLHSKSRSEIVRQAFQGQLVEIDAKKNKVLSKDERDEMLQNLGSVMNYLSSVDRNMVGIGSNVNQIAKRLNTDGLLSKTDRVKFSEYMRYIEELNGKMDVVSERLNEIWQSLV